MSGHAKHSHSSKINVSQLVDTVAERSKLRGERMTSVRKDVVEALAKQKSSCGAYDLLADLNKKRVPQMSAMSLYRTLDFLIELGVVIKIESQNTYKICAGHDHAHSHLLMVCQKCHRTKEVEDCAVEAKLQNLTKKYGYTLQHNVIEFKGLCETCS